MLIFALPNSSTLDQAALCFSVSRSHTIRHTQPVWLLWTSEQPVTGAAT